MAISGKSLYSTALKIANGEYGGTHYRGTNGSQEGQYNIGQWDGQNFCFDCSGLIKAIIWGWNGSKTASFGGASYNSNGCPDINDAGFAQYCTHDIAYISQAPIGAILWKQGHVGIYGGGGKTVECTTTGNYKVQTGTVNSNGDRTVGGVSGGSWQKWGTPDFIDYSGSGSVSNAEGASMPASMSAEDWGKALVAQIKSHLGDGYDALGGCSSTVGLCLREIGYCPDSFFSADNKCFWAAQNQHGVLDDSSYFTKVSGSPRDGDILVSWGVHTGIYGDGGTYENVPASHTGGGCVIHVGGICSCLGSPSIYRMTRNGGTLSSGAAWTGAPSGDWDSTNAGASAGRNMSGSVDLHKYSINNSSLREYTVYKPEVSYLTTTVQHTGDMIVSDNSAGATTRKRSTGLLSTSTLVESPFVSVQIGDYLFGSYTKKQAGNVVNVDYPNYVTGLSVTKINGAVNTYAINLHYQIQAGDNPNMIDEILSQVGYGTIYLSYGDWNMPSFIFKQESALITSVSTRVNFANSSIDYTIKCTSNSVSIAGLTYYFPKRVAKPSQVISTLIQNGNTYGLTQAFPGLYNDKVKLNKLLADLVNLNDSTVEIDAQEGMNSVSYINYLVTCMIPAGTRSGALSNSSYYMTVVDDVNGAYFTVNKFDCSGVVPDSYNVYEVDVGFPDINNNSNVVFDFSLNNDNSWSLLYNYGEKTSMNDVVYKISNDGVMYTEESKNLFTKNKEYRMSAKQQAWWTNMTQFPVNATLKIKGLLRPQMLMSYVRINSYFYGHKHISSGLYVITKEVDEVTASGYRTTLSLTRIAGDNDTISYKTVNKVVKLPVVSYTEERRKETVTPVEDPTGQNWTRSYTYSNNSDGSAVASNGGVSSGSYSGGDIANAIVIKNGATLTADEMNTLKSMDYYMKMIAAYCKQAGWTKNATVGFMCYIYSEGRPMGFYTYENPWTIADPYGQKGGSPSNYPKMCTSNQEWLDKYLTYENAYKNYTTVGAACPCLGMGMLSETDTWYVGGGKQLTAATELVNAATAAGRCWYDPSFYIGYSVNKWEQNINGDADWADPHSFNGSASEYAKRTLCAYGMMGWSASTVEANHPGFAKYWSSSTVSACEKYWNAV